ncbi:hypothetical protein BKA57DRAFT_493123 [Linnemannia elongata]|nr:hypothetical protein BKA57DRAFT_493123 [Linnemannia elongata]
MTKAPPKIVLRTHHLNDTSELTSDTTRPGRRRDGRAVFTFYSNSKDSHQRTHHVKKLHGMLPTLNSMQARKPNLYPTCLCRQCELEKEDNEHVWNCSSAAETTTTIWKEAMGKIDEWGVQATNNYNAARKREHQRAVDNGRQAPRPVLIHWRPPRDADHVRGFSSIGGARAVHSGSPAPDRDKNPKWNVSDLLRGITPKSMLTEWCAVFRTPQSIAKTVLHKFIGYLETQASERIWKPRCSATIAWEQTQGISVKDKTSKYTGPRGDWSQGYEKVAKGFGVVDLQQDTHFPIKGRTDGHASSTKVELMGLIAAVVAAPDEQDIVVRLDNQAVVDQYQHMVQDRENTLPRKRFRSNYAGLWAVLSGIVDKRQGRVEVKWIRGHNNDPGNELADRTAKEAAQGDTTPWVVDLTQQEDIRTFAFCHEALVETDLRQLLKQQTTIRHHQHWTSQRRVKKAVPHLDDVEWRSTLAFVHARRAVFTFYSNSKDTRQRSHHIKKLHGMLPTRNSMMARHPDLYPDCICRVCTEEEEDNEHLWTCPAKRETTTAIWREAMDKIDERGIKATDSYNAAKKREHERAEASGRQVPPPVPVPWRCPSDEEHVRGFSSIGGAQSVYRGLPVPDRDLDPKWHASDLLRGITPKSMLSEWSSVFRSPKSIAQTVLHKFVGYLEAQASELIWKPRCSETIAWEQAQGITTKDKTSKYTGPRGDWSNGYGYITRAGFCPCGASLAAHENGHCPGPSLDPTAADARLLESQLGRRRLSLMERMGRIPFMRVCE